MNRSPVVYRDWLRQDTTYESALTLGYSQIDIPKDGNEDVSINNWIGYGCAGAGLVFSSLEPFVFKSELSLSGKIVTSLGMIFDGLSFTAAQIGMTAYINSERSYDEYLLLTDNNTSDLYDKHKDSLDFSQLMAVGGIS